MKHLCYFLPFLLLACQSEVSTDTNTAKEATSVLNTPKKIHSPVFQSILDSTLIFGTILFFDPQNNTYYSNDFDRATHGFLPASTFKIPNSFIALETGVVDTNSIMKWDGEKRQLEIWEKDMDLKEAYRISCVPCYQWIAREIGIERMQGYLKKFNYSGMDVTAQTLDNFWLDGKSRISPMQEIEFLEKIYQQTLPVAQSTFGAMKKIMLQDSTAAYTLRAKSGWVIRDNFNIGWYVGYFETDGKVYYFATNIEPTDTFDMKNFPGIRKMVSIKAFKQLMDN